MGKGINLRLISSREMWRQMFLPVVADVCCCHDYWTVCELMSEHYSKADAEQRKEVADVLVSISESWSRGRLVEDGEIILKDEFTDDPRVQPVSNEQKEMESRLPMNAKQIEWLQRWAEEPQQCDEAPEPVKGGAVSGMYHYSLMWSNDELRAIYDRLVNNGYFAPQTTFGQWVWVCTGKGTSEAHTAIVWQKSTVLLACLVVVFCGVNDDTKQWKIAENVFRLADGETPKVSTMKSYVSAKKNDRQETDDWRRLENLLIIDSQPPKEFGVV